jgi:uncharacterized membrane protein YphA (DoxX/SURF4 family)
MGLVACDKCLSVISLDDEVCPHCGASQWDFEELGTDGAPQAPELAVATAMPKASPKETRPSRAAESQVVPKPSVVPALPYGRLLVLVIVSSIAVASLHFTGLLSDWAGLVLAFDLLALILLATNPWNLRARAPLLGSPSKVRAGAGWVVLLAVALFSLVPSSGNVTALSFLPDLKQASLNIWQSAKPVAQGTATPVAVASPTPAATPTKAPAFLLVGNTGGVGVWLRGSPSMADKVRAWVDSTKMLVVGPECEAEGRVWCNVKDPAGNVGWIPAEYLLTP